MNDQKQPPFVSNLTEREREVMSLVAVGLSNKEIARQLELSAGTVRLHLYRVYQKIGVGNRTALVAALARKRKAVVS
jgi:DNA-binding NarL/FixJ family response regulator